MSGVKVKGKAPYFHIIALPLPFPIQILYLYLFPLVKALSLPVHFSEGITLTLPFSRGCYHCLAFYLSIQLYPLPASLTSTLPFSWEITFYLGNNLFPG
jgi:hypothetical protein